MLFTTICTKESLEFLQLPRFHHAAIDKRPMKTTACLEKQQVESNLLERRKEGGHYTLSKLHIYICVCAEGKCILCNNIDIIHEDIQ